MKDLAINAHIGRRLRRRRRLLGLSLKAVADAAGTSFQQIHKYEEGDATVSAAKLLLIARALDVAVSYFYDGLERQGDRASGGSLRDVAEAEMFLDEVLHMAKPERDLLIDLVVSLATEDLPLDPVRDARRN